jgi:hypothetical protein
MTTENNGGPSNATLGDDWVIVLLGGRTLLGKLDVSPLPPCQHTPRCNVFSNGRPECVGPAAQKLEPAYQIEMRPQPQQSIDPATKQPVMIMGRARNIMPVAELEGFTSLELPNHGVVIKPLSELHPAVQTEMRQAVVNIEAAIAANERKRKINAEAAAAEKLTNFGGGARKD